MKPDRSYSRHPLLTEGEVGPLLIRLTIPMIFGILSMVIFNLTDTFFVGRLGKDQLAAISFTFPVVLVIGSLAHGIGMGASAVISRAIGANDLHKVRRLATDSLTLALLVVGFFSIIGLFTIDPLFRLLGADDHILTYIRQYMRIWYFGMIFVVVPMVGNNAIRATGDTKTPGVVMTIGALLNAVFDPILIFGFGPVPAYGIAGAAMATLFGRSITFFVAIYVLAWRENLLLFNRPHIREVLNSWKEILKIGIPNAGTKMIIPLGAGAVTRIISVHGLAAVAGFGVATRIEFFALAAVNALSTVIGPFIGQNTGAGRGDRVREGFLKGGLYSLAAGLFFFLLFLPLGTGIAKIFNNDPEVIRNTALYLRIVSFAYGLQGIYLIVTSGLNVLKKPVLAALISLVQMFALTIPLALAGSYFFGTAGIFTAVLISYSATGLLSVLIILKEMTRSRAD